MRETQYKWFVILSCWLFCAAKFALWEAQSLKTVSAGKYWGRLTRRTSRVGETSATSLMRPPLVWSRDFSFCHSDEGHGNIMQRYCRLDRSIYKSCSANCNLRDLLTHCLFRSYNGKASQVVLFVVLAVTSDGIYTSSLLVAVYVGFLPFSRNW